VTEVIAHRGASRAERENTLAAFRRARELGAGWVELDVRPSFDRRLVVHHDAHYDDGSAVVEVLAADRPAHVPLLDAAMAACAGMRVNVEIKNDPTEPGFEPDGWFVPAVVDELRRLGDVPRVLVSSFHRGTIDRVRALEPALATACLVDAVPPHGRARDALLDGLAAGGHCALYPWWGLVDAQLVTECHAHGLIVNVWTCDNPEAMARLAGAGVDGICTNVPDVAVAVLAALG
jgi:glycerophosphoryl diester phosphodiesterase